MNTEILGVAVQIVLMVVLAYPLGRYIARVYKGEKTWSDPECILVCMGNGVTGIARLASAQSRRKRGSNT